MFAQTQPQPHLLLEFQVKENGTAYMVAPHTSSSKDQSESSEAVIRHVTSVSIADAACVLL